MVAAAALEWAAAQLPCQPRCAAMCHGPARKGSAPQLPCPHCRTYSFIHVALMLPVVVALLQETAQENLGHNYHYSHLPTVQRPVIKSQAEERLALAECMQHQKQAAAEVGARLEHQRMEPPQPAEAQGEAGLAPAQQAPVGQEQPVGPQQGLAGEPAALPDGLLELRQLRSEVQLLRAGESAELARLRQELAVATARLQALPAAGSTQTGAVAALPRLPATAVMASAAPRLGSTPVFSQDCTEHLPCEFGSLRAHPEVCKQ